MSNSAAGVLQMDGGEEDHFKDVDLDNDDSFFIYAYKVLECPRNSRHDWKACYFAHPGESASRRDPRLFKYMSVCCPESKQKLPCPRGQKCPFAHNLFEYWLHPSRYRTQMCNDGARCPRSICFFAHSLEELRTPVYQPLNPEQLKLLAESYKATVEATVDMDPADAEAVAGAAAAAAAACAAAAGVAPERSAAAQQVAEEQQAAAAAIFGSDHGSPFHMEPDSLPVQLAELTSSSYSGSTLPSPKPRSADTPTAKSIDSQPEPPPQQPQRPPPLDVQQAGDGSAAPSTPQDDLSSYGLDTVDDNTHHRVPFAVQAASHLLSNVAVRSPEDACMPWLQKLTSDSSRITSGAFGSNQNVANGGGGDQGAASLHEMAAMALSADGKGHYSGSASRGTDATYITSSGAFSSSPAPTVRSNRSSDFSFPVCNGSGSSTNRSSTALRNSGSGSRNSGSLHANGAGYCYGGGSGGGSHKPATFHSAGSNTVGGGYGGRGGLSAAAVRRGHPNRTVGTVPAVGTAPLTSPRGGAQPGSIYGPHGQRIMQQALGLGRGAGRRNGRHGLGPVLTSIQQGQRAMANTLAGQQQQQQLLQQALILQQQQQQQQLSSWQNGLSSRLQLPDMGMPAYAMGGASDGARYGLSSHGGANGYPQQHDYGQLGQLGGAGGAEGGYDQMLMDQYAQMLLADNSPLMYPDGGQMQYSPDTLSAMNSGIDGAPVNNGMLSNLEDFNGVLTLE